MGEDNSSGERYSRPPSFALSSNQREYVSTGDPPGSYRKGKLEQDVQDKLNQFPERIDFLFDDIELLADNGYLDDAHWTDAWLELLGIENADDQGEILEKCLLSADIEGGRPTSAPQELAREFGRALSRLMLNPGDEEDFEQMEKDMIWGLVQGFYLDGRYDDGPAIGDARADAVEDLLGYLDGRLQSELEHDEDIIERHESMQERHESTMARDRQFRERIRDILDETEGVEPASRGGEGYDTGVSPREVYPLLIDKLTEEPVEEDSHLPNKLGTAGQEALFMNQHAPFAEGDVEELVTREDVHDVVAQYNLVAKGKIGALVYDDVEELADTVWRGVDAPKTLQAIHEAKTPPRSADIAQSVATDSHKGSVTTLCKKLAGGEWEPAILTGDRTGWELTTYGEFVAKELTAREERDRKPTEGLHIMEFSPHIAQTAPTVAAPVAEIAEEAGVELWEPN